MVDHESVIQWLLSPIWKRAAFICSEAPHAQPLPRTRDSFAATSRTTHPPPRLNLPYSGDATVFQANPDLRQRHLDLEVTPWPTFDEPTHEGRGEPRQWRHTLRTIGGHGLVLGSGIARPNLCSRRLARATQSAPSPAATPRARLGPRGHTTAEACSMLTGGTLDSFSLARSQERGLSPTHSSVASTRVAIMARQASRIGSHHSVKTSAHHWQRPHVHPRPPHSALHCPDRQHLLSVDRRVIALGNGRLCPRRAFAQGAPLARGPRPRGRAQRAKPAARQRLRLSQPQAGPGHPPRARQAAPLPKSVSRSTSEMREAFLRIPCTGKPTGLLKADWLS